MWADRQSAPLHGPPDAGPCPRSGDEARRACAVAAVLRALTGALEVCGADF